MAATFGGCHFLLMITLRSLPKAIVHVDCDAFFASVEQSLRPELKGKPVITGKERGIAASMSYEAKRQGVTRGMRLFEAKKVCPEAIILPSDYETYSLFSKRIFGIIRRFTPDVEEYSIDEAFLDLTGLRRVYRTSYEAIALRIKETLERELGITVSVGLSLTKTLAKIASRHKKPSGFTCVKGHELHRFLPQIPLERVCGFGPASVALLAKHRIFTVWDYIRRPEYFAKGLFGKIGIELWHELRGDFIYPLVTAGEGHQASLSKTKTFTPPSHEREFVRAQALRNLESAFIKLRRHRLRAKRLAVCLTDNEYNDAGLEVVLHRSTASTLEVSNIVSELVDRLFDPHLEYRSTAIILRGLEYGEGVQGDLFEDPARIRALRELSQCVDEVNHAYGKHCLHLGSTHSLGRFQQHLGARGDLPRRRMNPLRGETTRQHLAIPLWEVKIR